jgi:hypothetical protein
MDKPVARPPSSGKGKEYEAVAYGEGSELLRKLI